MDKLDIESLINDVYNDEYLHSFIEEHNLDKTNVQKNLSSFLAYLSSNKKCANCKGLDNCLQTEKGMKVDLKYTYHVEPFYKPCSKKVKKDQESISHLYVHGYNFDELSNKKPFVTLERQEALTKIKNFLSDYKKGKDCKGIYFYGPYGTGKTFLMAYIASNLAKNGTDVIFMYYQDLISKMKSFINTGELAKAILELQNIDVLMLDDLGSETCTGFIRDDILSPILQYRMNNHLPTFMTSNMNKKELLAHLAETKDQICNMRASRILERMEVLMDFVEITGQNYRK